MKPNDLLCAHIFVLSKVLSSPSPSCSHCRVLCAAPPSRQPVSRLIVRAKGRSYSGWGARSVAGPSMQPNVPILYIPLYLLPLGGSSLLCHYDPSLPQLASESLSLSLSSVLIMLESYSFFTLWVLISVFTHLPWRLKTLVFCNVNLIKIAK